MQEYSTNWPRGQASPQRRTRRPLLQFWSSGATSRRRISVVAWRMPVRLHLKRVSPIVCRHAGAVEFCANAGRNTSVRRGFESSTGKPVWHLLATPSRARVRCPAANAGGTTEFLSRCRGFESRRILKRARSSGGRARCFTKTLSQRGITIAGENRWHSDRLTRLQACAVNEMGMSALLAAR